MKTEEEWVMHAQGLLKAELKKRHVTYKELAEKLKDFGVEESAPNIANKISRGGFSAVFFLQCLAAIGCTTLRIEAD